jgi:general secretion pathway protein F
MPVFTYKAAGKGGKIVTGQMEMADRRMVIASLQQSELLPIRIEEERLEGGVAEYMTVRFSRVKAKDIIFFTQQLSMLLNSGIQLDRSLTILQEMIEKKKLRDIITNLQNNIHGGDSFADALSKHPKIFSKLYINMVRAGETSGALDRVIKRLAEFLDNAQKLKDEVVTAMYYPVFILFVAIGSVALLLMFVVPRFASMFDEVGVALPLSTQILLSLSYFLGSYWWALLLGMAGVALLLNYFVRTEEGRYLWDGWKLKIPLLGNLTQKIEVSRFSRTLGTLISSGVPILHGIMIVKEIIGNEVISRSLLKIHGGLKEGEGISGPLKESGHFPPLATHMIAIGEETGQLDVMLGRVAENFDEDVKVTIKRLIGLLEPAMILIMAMVVGFIVISMLLAIFSINEMPF